MGAGRVIGAGSFGVVRECIEAATGRRAAVKTIGKVRHWAASKGHARYSLWR